ncbi:MAG: hypothetical protein NTU53_13555 [Planctomycetota bacterium]|nr:hypothetical protein [Planctomycetota bacterium]
MRTIKDECLHRMIFFGEQSLRKAAREFLAHYHVAVLLPRRGLNDAARLLGGIQDAKSLVAARHHDCKRNIP